MDQETSPSQLAAFLRSHRHKILAAWHEALRDRPAARGLSMESLLDHIPDLLDAIAETGEAYMDDPRARLSTDTAERHALERLTEGTTARACSRVRDRLPRLVVELLVLLLTAAPVGHVAGDGDGAHHAVARAHRRGGHAEHAVPGT
jgi:hypothetical protein